MTLGSTLTLSGSTVQLQLRHRRPQGAGGCGGHGVGGGVYNLGVFTLDVATIIKKNHASTSNDDIFPT